MHADLEFEYPHKLEKVMVKGNILEWLDQEEQKLKMLASETYDFDDSLTDEQKLLESDSVLTYDRYYAQVEASNAQID